MKYCVRSRARTTILPSVRYIHRGAGRRLRKGIVFRLKPINEQGRSVEGGGAAGPLARIEGKRNSTYPSIRKSIDKPVYSSSRPSNIYCFRNFVRHWIQFSIGPILARAYIKTLINFVRGARHFFLSDEK